MTKKTEGFVLSVYDFCLKLVLQAKREGILALEEYLYNQCLTESGKFIFNRKIDQFLYWFMRFLVFDAYEAGYTSKTGQNLLKSFSKRASRRTKLALNVAFLCIDGLMNDRRTELIYIEVCSYLGVKLHQKLWNITIKLQHGYEKYNKGLILTDDQKLRLEEVNGFFKLKEEECKRLLMQKHKKLSEIQKKLPGFKNATTIKLIYHSGKSDFVLFEIPDPFRSPTESYLICGISVCSTLYEFWKHYLICDYRIERLMDKTDDIPNEIAKNLEMKTEMQLSLTE